VVEEEEDQRPPAKRIVYVRRVAQARPTPVIPDFSKLPIYEQLRIRSELRINISKFMSRCPQYRDWLPEDLDFERDALDRLHSYYENCVKEAKKDQRLIKYKAAIAAFCAAVEYVGCTYGKSPFKYFMLDQLKMMNFYEHYLLDISARSTGGFGEGWSPEAKLVAVILLNAVLYLGLNFLFMRNGWSTEAMMNAKSQVIHFFIGAPGRPAPQVESSPDNPGVSAVPDDLTQPDLMAMMGGLFRNFRTGFRGDTATHHHRTAHPQGRAPREPPFSS